jgi:hypothetical protein
MGVASQKAAPIATLCPCQCGVTLFPGAELGYASPACIERALGSAPLVTKSSVPPPSLYKVRAGNDLVSQEENQGEKSGTITPGQIPAPPPPIVFPSQYAKEGDQDERDRKYDIFMEYATEKEIAAFQRAMIKQGLMDEPPEEEDDFMNAPVEPLLKPAVSQAQVLWARDMIAQHPRKSQGTALHVMLFLKNPIRTLFIFNVLRSRHCQRALLG